MSLWVMYHDSECAFLPAELLDRLINKNEVVKFYRNSEERWVTIGVDPIRIGKRKDKYNGLERRKTPPL